MDALPYHALLFSSVVLVSTGLVSVAREDDAYTPEDIGVEFNVPLPLGIYSFPSKELRDKFLRRANGYSEIEVALAIKLK
jgi:hypothetical protein